MKQAIECIVDENGIEINVLYEYEIGESQIEYGHGKHEVGLGIEVQLKIVEIIFGGRGTDILPYLNKKQVDFIMSKLTYNGE